MTKTTKFLLAVSLISFAISITGALWGLFLPAGSDFFWFVHDFKSDGEGSGAVRRGTTFETFAKREECFRIAALSTDAPQSFVLPRACSLDSNS